MLIKFAAPIAASSCCSLVHVNLLHVKPADCVRTNARGRPIRTTRPSSKSSSPVISVSGNFAIIPLCSSYPDDLNSSYFSAVFLPETVYYVRQYCVRCSVLLWEAIDRRDIVCIYGEDGLVDPPIPHSHQPNLTLCASIKNLVLINSYLSRTKN